MSSRNFAEEKSFKQRKYGAMKKCSQLWQAFNVKVTMYIDDNGELYSFTHDPDWQPGEEFENAHKSYPEDFMTEREARALRERAEEDRGGVDCVGEATSPAPVSQIMGEFQNDFLEPRPDPTAWCSINTAEFLQPAPQGDDVGVQLLQSLTEANWPGNATAAQNWDLDGNVLSGISSERLETTKIDPLHKQAPSHMRQLSLGSRINRNAVGNQGGIRKTNQSPHERFRASDKTSRRAQSSRMNKN